jgi:phage tail protein X
MGFLKQHVVTVVMILSSALAGCAQHDQYITAALEHADQSITNGQGRDNNALAEQATVALRYAWLAERNNKDGRLQDAIRALKEAISHARYGRTDASVQAVKDAYKLLAEIE